MTLFSGSDETGNAGGYDIPAGFRTQAIWCDYFGSRLTAGLCNKAADNCEAGGIVYDLVGNWPEPPEKAALALRLTGALHGAVLSGRAPELADAYPTAAAPDVDIDKIWPIAEQYLRDDTDWVREFLDSPPQTNETRRSLGLLVGFLDAARKGAPGPFHMLELGASAGLNLHWDRFRYETDAWSWGPEDGPLMSTDWSGRPPANTDHSFEIASRLGCDLNPLDVNDPDDVLRLRAYIWPDQPERLARLNGAISVAQTHGVTVGAASADTWIADNLDGDLPAGSTVVYHSIFYQYPPREVRHNIATAIETAGDRADADHQLHWVRLEPFAAIGGPQDDPSVVLSVISWPGGTERILADIDPHVRTVKMK